MTSSNFLPPFLNDLPAQFEPLREFLTASLKPYIKITESEGSDPGDQDPVDPFSLWQSKIGGNPYFPKDAVYPMDPESGEAMVLVAQINLAEVPFIPASNLPKQGVLQFYLGGYEWADAYAEQSRSKVLFFPEVSVNQEDLITDFSFINLDETLRVDHSTIYSLTFEISRDLFWGSRYGEALQSPPGLEALCREFSTWLFDYYFESCADQLGSKLGGYPDLHSNVGDVADGAVGPLLLELSKVDDSDDYLFWFIDPERLKALDFTQVQYYHECD